MSYRKRFKFNLTKCAVAGLLCLAALWWTVWPSVNNAAAQEGTTPARAIDGLWSGSWGGGERDGVIFQPVIAELYIKGDHIEAHGLRNVGSFAGTVHFDAATNKMRITPMAPAGALPAPKDIEYRVAVKGDTLTLIDTDKVSTVLHRHPVTPNPLANAQIQLVAATGISPSGDLLITEFTVLKAGQAGASYYHPEERSRSTKQATVFLVQEAGLKKIAVDEARGLIRLSMPVAIAYRDDERPPPPQFHGLWKDTGAPMPDSGAVLKTLAHALRPGTLFFILSARANAPRP